MGLLNNSPLELIGKLIKKINSDWEDSLREINIYLEFEEIYKLPYSNKEKNQIVAFVILAYDYQSAQIDVRKDRQVDKSRILRNIGMDLNTQLFKDIVSGNEETIRECGFNYAMSRKNWKFYSAIQLIELSAENMRYAQEKTKESYSKDERSKDGAKETFITEVDPKTIAAIRASKSDILEKAIEDRKAADKLIDEIKKEYGPIEKALEEEYGFQISNEENFNIESWADYTRQRNAKKEKEIKLSAPRPDSPVSSD